ncbi:threonine ammonia-lyase, biosynthetic [Actinomyces vulturis]|uniref:threonine ammonia-lyase, biosynthetic n=1 Tax=Actinomyces vulturis TaxID=1857645 RepID=UPI00082E4CB8|nr:threonine ammonia-lyase, biosynthetic [Actinomyces vulturis]
MTHQDYLTSILKAPVYEVCEHTPLELMEGLTERLGNTVLIKREDRQPVHSFKLRGAYSKMASLSNDERAHGVVTASAGNHAQGVAFSGKKLGIRSVIVMPVPTAEIKVTAVRSMGGEVILFGQNFDEAKAHAEQLAQEQGLTYIPPFDDPMVIAGQGTIGLEMIQQDAGLDAVFVPVGGGGLASGIAVLMKQLMPSVKVVAVEPEEAACLRAAFETGVPVTLERVGQFAEGVAVKRIGEEPFRLLRDVVDDIVTVGSDEISAAVKDIFDDTRAVAEPAGAVGLAGLKKYCREQGVVGKRMATVLSGANVNFHTLRYISERAELGERRETLLAVRIPERQGEFLRFCQVIGERAVTEFDYRVSNPQWASILVGISLREGEAERVELIKRLEQFGYEVSDLTDDEIAKLHVRYMVGGVSPTGLDESVYSFEFPEYPGALLKFLSKLGTQWSITLFHYRSHGTDYGRVLAGFEDVRDDTLFVTHLDELDYSYREVTSSAAYTYFLA